MPLRFKGFTQPWQRTKLVDLASKITMGQFPQSSNYTTNPQDYILVQGNSDIVEQRIVPRTYTTQITKQAQVGDLIFTVRAQVGGMAITEYPVVLGRGVCAIASENKFLYYALQAYKQQGHWELLASGTIFASITSSQLKNITLAYPEVEEQEKIINLFEQVYQLIAQTDQLVHLYEQQKFILMQALIAKS
ncbi:restriction endonuclease subunit S [Psittacicella hinzii]|uniref:Type I restriction modification DNA specificity domain-containing protein n=1 Tax=Psittacicella hinzii TaxID=2028575 RepID=A0A3A1YMF3_9GAMM|nr:restriction endonuclease subunit S [Psittacicella hinzii]RIY38636.1 hypothetical protein CKF58_03790 [Psittacicella hinzii]